MWEPLARRARVTFDVSAELSDVEVVAEMAALRRVAEYLTTKLLVDWWLDGSAYNLVVGRIDRDVYVAELTSGRRGYSQPVRFRIKDTPEWLSLVQGELWLLVESYQVRLVINQTLKGG